MQKIRSLNEGNYVPRMEFHICISTVNSCSQATWKMLMENMRTTKHALCESTRGKQKLQTQAQVSEDDGGLEVEVILHQLSHNGFHLSAPPIGHLGW